MRHERVLHSRWTQSIDMRFSHLCVTINYRRSAINYQDLKKQTHSVSLREHLQTWKCEKHKSTRCWKTWKTWKTQVYKMVTKEETMSSLDKARREKKRTWLTQASRSSGESNDSKRTSCRLAGSCSGELHSESWDWFGDTVQRNVTRHVCVRMPASATAITYCLCFSSFFVFERES